MNRRFASIVLTLLAACVDAASDPELGESTQAITPMEGQGWDLQGWDLQGWDLQGWDLQGWDLQGGTLDGQALAGVNVIGTQLEVWRNSYIRAEQRLPDRICLWSLDRTVLYSCTVVNLATTPSPLAGVKLTGRFTKTDGTTFTASIRIGTGKTHVGAVTPDLGKVAMFPLLGHAPSSTCELVDEGVDGCQNPNDCRRNCDVWLYDLYFLPPDGQSLRWCPGNNLATAVDGTYSVSAGYKPTAPGITLACSNGTIAKCTRWGYRPYGSARKHCSKGTCTPDNTLYSLVEYHQSCIRAAMADYCALGVSFTRPGTLVDFWDYEPARNDSWGFIPRTAGLLENQGKQHTAFQWESVFDKYGGYQIEHLRYQERAPSIDDVCGEKFTYFSPGGDDVIQAQWLRNTINAAPPVVQVDSTTGCAHSELTVGKWLHSECSSCALPNGFAYCNDPADPRGWNAECVATATPACAMTSHSECSAGKALNQFATGCTIRVCATPGYESCCDAAGAWTSACVELADDICKGGQEQVSWFSSFCHGVVISPVPVPPPTTNRL